MSHVSSLKCFKVTVSGFGLSSFKLGAKIFSHCQPLQTLIFMICVLGEYCFEMGRNSF